MKRVRNAKVEAAEAVGAATAAEAVVVAGAEAVVGAAAMAVVAVADATEATAADTAATVNCGTSLTIEGSLWVAALAATIAVLRSKGFSR